MINTIGCIHAKIESGYCVNTGKVEQLDPKVALTICAKCYYKDGAKLVK